MFFAESWIVLESLRKTKKQYNFFPITDIIEYEVGEKGICCKVFTGFCHSFCSFETYCKEKKIKTF